MKVRSSIKPMCEHCYLVRRGKTRFVYCKENAKHKQRQGYHTMVHREGQYCIVCNAPSEVQKAISSASTTANIHTTTGVLSYMPTDFSKLSLSEIIVQKPQIEGNLKYNPTTMGIFSILNR